MDVIYRTLLSLVRFTKIVLFNHAVPPGIRASVILRITFTECFLLFPKSNKK